MEKRQGEEMKDQASSLRLLVAAKKLKNQPDYTKGKLEILLAANGYTVKEYYRLINDMRNLEAR